MEPVEFRAPPPSPVDSTWPPSLPSDSGDVFSEFLTTSLRVPNLVFPANKLLQQQTLPKVDFRALLCSDEHEHERGLLRDAVLDSLATIGCFQLLNHGITPEYLTSTAEAAAGIFRFPQENRAAAMRSPENPCGFEECDAEEERSEFSEEFVWCRDHNFSLKMERIWPNGYSNFSEKMDTLSSIIEKVAEKVLSLIFEDIPKKCANSAESSRGHELGTLCCVYKHSPNNKPGPCQWTNSLKYDIIRMLIRGTIFSHSLCLHLCDDSSEFHVYSKKGSLSFFHEKGAIIVTAGDQTQVLSDGHYKHVIGRPIFKADKQENISMAFLYSPINTKNKNFQTDSERTLSLGQQAMLAIILNLVCHFLIHFYKIF